MPRLCKILDGRFKGLWRCGLDNSDPCSTLGYNPFDAYREWRKVRYAFKRDGLI